MSFFDILFAIQTRRRKRTEDEKMRRFYVGFILYGAAVSGLGMFSPHPGVFLFGGLPFLIIGIGATISFAYDDWKSERYPQIVRKWKEEDKKAAASCRSPYAGKS